MIPRGPQGPIQRIAVGLRGLLDLFGSETAPNAIDGLIRPQIELLPFFLAARRSYVAQTGTTGIASFSFASPTVPIQVPAGRVWLLTHCSAFGVLPPGAGNHLNGMSLAYRSAADGFGAVTIASMNYGLLPTLDGRPRVSWDGLLVMNAGDQLGIGLDDMGVAAPPFTFSVQAIYADVPV